MDGDKLVIALVIKFLKNRYVNYLYLLWIVCGYNLFSDQVCSWPAFWLTSWNLSGHKIHA